MEWRRACAILAGLACAASASASPFPFAPFYRALESGGRVACVASADMNLDGRVDLVASSVDAGTVSVLLGRGGGIFDPHRDYPGRGGAGTLAVRDLNRDGIPDVVVQGGGGLSVLLGTGDGSLRPGPAVSVYGPRSFALGDVDADGFLDLAVVAGGGPSSHFTLVLGRGDGSFASEAAPVPITTLKFDQFDAVALGDLSGDGRADLVLLMDSYGSAWLRVGIARTDGTFDYRDYRGVAPGGSLRIEDLDGDGSLDLVAPGYGGVVVLLNAGDGTLSAPLASAGGGASLLGVRDVDRDGRLDLVTPNAAGNGLDLMRGDGAGAFGLVGEFGIGLVPNSAAIADLDDDGWPDVATAAPDDRSIAVVLGNGDGTVGRVIPHFPCGAAPAAIAVTDLNSDGVSDLAVTDPVTRSVMLLAGDGDGGFRAPTYLATGLSPVAAAIGDFDGDRVTDLAVPSNYGSAVAIYRGNGAGAFSRHDITTGMGPTAAAAGDLDGDGRDDLVVAAGRINAVSVHLATGSGSFAPRVDYATANSPTAIALADFDRDGRLDLVVATRDVGVISVLLGRGDGSFGARRDLGMGSIVSLLVGDVDRDRCLDLVATTTSHAIVLLRGDGRGGFGPQSYPGIGFTPGAVALADVDRNGYPDLLVADPEGRAVLVMTSAAGRAFAERHTLHLESGPAVLAVADLNRDGAPDLATGYAGWLSVLLATRPPVRAAPEQEPVPSSDAEAGERIARVFAAPNPARGAVDLRLVLPAAGHARLRIVDVTGRTVRELVDATLPAGDHRIRWDGRTASGARARPGLYLVEITCGDRRAAERLILLGE